MTYVIYRTLTGSPMFTAILSTKSKVKVLTASDMPKYANQFKAKFTALVKTKEGQLVFEHCQVKFLNPDDRNNFMDVFQQSQTVGNDK